MSTNEQMVIILKRFQHYDPSQDFVHSYISDTLWIHFFRMGLPPLERFIREASGLTWKDIIEPLGTRDDLS